MQLGMVGLGRMGAGLVGRLTRAGHDCVGSDPSPDARKAIEGFGAKSADSMADLVKKLEKPRADLADGARGDHGPARRRAGRAARAGRHRHRWRQQLLPRRRRPCGEAEAEGHPLRRRRHERRRVRPRAWLLPHDRGRGRRGEAPRPDLQDDRSRRRVGRAHARVAPASRRRPRTATSTAGRRVPATS